jgi:hypothetical protein
MEDELVKKMLALKLDDPTRKAIERMAHLSDPLRDAMKAMENSSLAQLQRQMREMNERSGLFGLAETARRLNENSSITRMIESLNQHKDLARTAFGPMWELREAGAFQAPWHREMEKIRATLGTFEARFRLPEMEETARLYRQFEETSVTRWAKGFAENSGIEALRKLTQPSNDLLRAMESMRSPWLDVQASLKSIAGFSEIQGIGASLRQFAAFDETLSATLRLSLGDWRDEITWRPEVLNDLAARSEFYLGLGFNPALTDFPLPAFEQSLGIAGLRPLAALVEAEAEVVDDDDGEEVAFHRTNAAQGVLLRLERLLRKFIEEEMTKAFGPNWMKHRLPNGLRDQWEEKKKKAENDGAEERALIEYIDFTDYVRLICKADNWKDVFSVVFGRIESVRETFQRLHPIRLDTAHGRLITQDDELLLSVESKRLEKAIRKRRG